LLGIGAGPFMSIEPDATTAVELGRSVAPDYTVWTQELTTRSFAYRRNFVLSTVPEPAAAALFGLGLPALRTIRRRRPPAAVTPIQSSK